MVELLRKEISIENNYPILYGVFEDEKKIDINSDINESIMNLNLSYKFKEVNKVYTLNKTSFPFVVIVGLGKRNDYSIKKLSQIIGVVLKHIDEKTVVLFDSFIGELDYKLVAKAFMSSFCYYSYQYDEFKSNKKEKNLSIYFKSTFDIYPNLEEGYNIGIAQNNCRDLVNKPYNYLNANDLALYCNNLVDSLNNKFVKIEVLDKKEIEKLQMGAFLGVNKGSDCEPKLIHLQYQPNENLPIKVCLIGKGLMYDTGGYSLKSSMNTMKCDMGGAASVLGAFEAIVKNNVSQNVAVVICATDNKISPNALLPDDILISMNKKSIEIVSTDAEGRLTLADALTYAQTKGYKEIIDVATLTGAIVVALGDYTTGLFGNDVSCINEIKKAATVANEEVWHMPINESTVEAVRSSKVADITNSIGRSAGACGAAAFIQEFVNLDTKWVHLDIAGTAFHTTPKYNEAYGATGVMVKTLYQYVLNK